MPTILRSNELPQGFSAAGVAAGIKSAGKADMALLACDTDAVVAATFTTNRMPAASVQVCREHLRGGLARAVIVNSGNANACTGEGGLADARRMAALTATTLGVPESQVFVCSTGHIGDRLPMDRIEHGIARACAALRSDGGEAMAEAIMTTDTRKKTASVELVVDTCPVRMSACCKGAGMIEPNMATMLCFVATDAAVEQSAVQELLRDAVDQSFNRISVDGDQSTNDTVLLLSNGLAGNQALQPGHPDWPAFAEALHALLHDLALQIVRDGEGAKKLVTIAVTGARSDAEADRGARAAANSLLVKTSWAGDSANWGRIMAALGYCGIEVDPARVRMRYDDVVAVVDGVNAGNDEAAGKVVEQSEFRIEIDLGLGSGSAFVYTCEITDQYVYINV